MFYMDPGNFYFPSFKTNVGNGDLLCFMYKEEDFASEGISLVKYGALEPLLDR